METLFLLIAGHYVADFALQNDFMAKNKAPGSCPMWWQILGGHCLIQALSVYLVTKSLPLSLLEFAAHFATDYSKCRGRLTFNQDQAIHVACKVAWAALFLGGIL